MQDPKYQFVSDSQDIEQLLYYLNIPDSQYDSFFVTIEDGDYGEVWGMEGTIPSLQKSVYKIQ